MQPEARLAIRASREARPYTGAEYVGRWLWSLAMPFFRFSPRRMFGWRRMMLRLFGARVGRSVHVYPSVRIVIPWNLDLGDESAVGEDVLIYNLGMVVIGEQATVSHRAHLCGGTHDFRDPTLPLVRSTVRIGARAWVCAQAFVGPDVQIGEGAVVGAGAVAMRDVDAWDIVSGNPASVIGRRTIRSAAE